MALATAKWVFLVHFFCMSDPLGKKKSIIIIIKKKRRERDHSQSSLALQGMSAASTGGFQSR